MLGNGQVHPGTAPARPRRRLVRLLSPLLCAALALGLAAPAGATPYASTGELAAGTSPAGPSTGTAPGARPGVLDLTSGLPVPTTHGTASAPVSAQLAAPSGVAPGVTAAVRAAVAADGTAPVLIRLREQVDLAAVAAEAQRDGLAAAASARAAAGGVDASARRAAARDADRTARARTVVAALQATATRTQQGVAEVLRSGQAAGHAGDVEPFWVFNGFAATVDATLLGQLEAHPDVTSITIDETVSLPEPRKPAGDPKLPTWSLENIHAPAVWGEYGLRGDGVVVGAMDSGVDSTHPALADTWRGNDGDTAASWFVATGENYPRPGDGFGHGTHVMGSIAGGTPGEVIGVAPEASWIAAKIFDDFGRASDSGIHAGFQWMLAPGGEPANAPDVVNNSWGTDNGADPEYLADVAAWVAAGIVPIFSNGNSGPAPRTVGAPASYPQSIGIGATDVDDVVAPFSSRGPASWGGADYRKPQVAAPGVDVVSAWPESLGGGYETLSGTSMAAPHATGTVALLLDAAPELSVDDVRALLEGTARVEPHMGALPDDAYGSGIVDAYATVTEAAFSGELSGTVTGPDGPVEATVAVSGTDLRTTSDPTTGSYELSVPAGTYEIVVSAYGYVPQEREVTVAAGESYSEDFVLVPAADHVVSGTVHGPDGPVAGAEVSLDPSPVASVESDETGAYSISVAAGTYTLRVRAAGFAPYAEQVVVDGPVEVDVMLTPLSSPSEPGWREYQNGSGRAGLSQDVLAAPSLVADWTADVDADVAFSSPVIADGSVFVSDDSGELAALDQETGEERWTYAAGISTRGTPAVVDGVVYAGGGVDGGIHAVDAETGAELWTVPTPDRLTVYATPTVVDGTLYVVTGPTAGRSDTVLALDPETGEQRWAVDVGTDVYAGPAVAEGLVVVGNADAGELLALDAADGHEVWRLDRESDHFVAGVSIADGVVYGSTTADDGSGGSVLAVDASSGEVLWQNDGNGDGQGSVPAVYDGLVIAGSQTFGTVTAYDRDDGSVAWTYSVDGAVSASVLVSGDGYVFGGSQLDRRVWALDAATGELAWESDVEANVTSSAAYAEGELVTADIDGTVYAYHPTGSLTGTVTGPDGPVAATVRVVETGAQAATDPDTGAYMLVERPGTYTLQASSYGLSTETETVQVPADGAVQVDFELTEVGSGSVVGTVAGEDGTPLAGATVTLVGTPLDPATTGADGGFAFDPVAVGTYRLRVELAGYAPAEEPVSVRDGESTEVDVELPAYQVGVTGDDGTRILDVLTDLGYRAEQTTYADVTARADDFEVIVANGRQDDPGDDAFDAFLAATDAAGTSVVFLDQWGLSYGSIQELVDHVGDPAAAPTGLGDDGRVFVTSTAEHPLTAGLPLDDRVELLEPDSSWSAFTGFSGATVADLSTDAGDTVGAAIGYEARGFGSTHVLLGSLAAAATWAGPEDTWLPPAYTILQNAVDYGIEAAYGEVSGTVTDDDGTPLAGVRVEDVGGTDATTTGPDGSYALLLAPGDHTLRFTLVGSEAVEEIVTVAADEALTLDVSLEPSGQGAVAGVVTSGRDGAAVEGATVTLVQLAETTTTGPDGGYSFADVPAGTYELTVSAPAHLTSSQQVEVTDGATTTADVVLEPAPVVGVLGDYPSDPVVPFLLENEIAAEEIDWADVDRVGDFDVVVFNDPDDPGEQTYRDFLAAMDAAGVSGVFGDGWLDGAIENLLVAYDHDPESTDWHNDDGTVAFHPLVESPLFDGLDGDPQVFVADSFATTFAGYSGTLLAEAVGETDGTLGISAAFSPRTPSSIHVLLGGFTSGLSHGIEDEWTAEGKTLYLNAITWAAAPGLAAVSGTVSDDAAEPIPGATVEVVGSDQRTTTDADGAYVLPLAAGDYTLRYSAFGYAPVEREISVEENDSVTVDVELTVGEVGTIAGVVDSTGEVEPPGGSARGTDVVVGATVTLLGTDRVATTDEQGRYVLDLVEPGSYELEVTADGFVRTRVDVVVVAGETTDRDIAIRPSPRVGVLDEDDEYPYATGYLEYWGYLPEEITWADTDRVAQLDLVMANLATYPNLDPGAAGWAAFEDAVNRAGVPVLWLDQFGRGSFQWLAEYDGDPATHGADRSNDTVTAVATDPDHPLLAGLPAAFPLVEDDAEYSWYGDFSGTTVATVTSSADPAAGGGLAGFRPRGAGAVDVLLGTLSISTYGWPAYGDVAGSSWTPEAERLLRNGLAYALDTDGLGAEVRGRLVDSDGAPVAGTVTVVETGETHPARSGDGAFVAPLLPGTWTLAAEAFGFEPLQTTVGVAAGDVLTPDLVLDAEPSGSVSGTVTDAAGSVVAGATVEVVGTPLATTTAADGTYEIVDVPVGDWTLSVDAPGLQRAEVPFTVRADETTAVDVTLGSSQAVAVFDDDTDTPIGNLLTDQGYAVEQFAGTQAGIDDLLLRVAEFRLVIFNDVSSSYYDEMAAVADAAAASGVSVIFAGQFGGDAIAGLVAERGDPASETDGFVEDTTIAYTPTAEHPIFAGFPVGEPITLMGSAGENQQWLVYGDYTGTTLAEVTTDDPDDGPVIGNGVGYRTTSDTSVEILLASLGAGAYGSPDEPVGAAGRWTDDAVTVYLNAVAWATTTEQGAVTGTVTSDGAPVAGATVTAVELDIGTVTGADGTYTLALPDGTHTIRVEAPAYEPAEQMVEIVDAGTVTADFDLEPLPTGTLLGTVTTEDGSAVEGAVVSGTGPEEFSTTTAADGTYEVGGLLEGAYEVTVSAAGYMSETATVTVAAGDPVTLDLSLTVVDVGVLGDADGAVTALLQARGEGAAEVVWDADLDLSPYEVLVVNGGEPDEATFDAVLAEAATEDVSLVYTGTWGVDQGGIRLLERYTDRVRVGVQGYGDSRVKVTRFDPDHPLFAGLPKPATILVKDSYYSVLEDYVGTVAGNVKIRPEDGGDKIVGTGIGYDWLTDGSVEVLLSASAVTDTQGPGMGWTRHHKRLLLNAVRWAADAEAPLRWSSGGTDADAGSAFGRSPS